MGHLGLRKRALSQGLLRCDIHVEFVKVQTPSVQERGIGLGTFSPH